MAQHSSLEAFRRGLVFGFDLGTSSIGHAVRDGAVVEELGVVEVPNETASLEDRNRYRRGRRTLDHRQSRRDWFAQQLAGKMGVALHQGTRLPKDGWVKGAKGGWVPTDPSLTHPIGLRVRALRGEPINRVELFTALTHLIKRRGYNQHVFWKTEQDEEQQKKDAEDTHRNGTIPADQVRAEFEEMRAALGRGHEFHPAHFLLELASKRTRERKEGVTPVPGRAKQRKRAWPQDLMIEEARSLMKAQAPHYPVFSRTVKYKDVTGAEREDTVMEWLLFGNSGRFIKSTNAGGDGRTHRVFLRNHRDRQRAPFTQQAARIHNRGPGLDLIKPYDDEGRPLHVLSRDDARYRRWQAEIALANFTVRDLTSSRKNKPSIVPPAEALAELRELIARKKSVTADDLQEWVKPWREKRIFDLHEKQSGLVGEGQGRGRFSAIGIEKALEILRPLQAEQQLRSALTPRSQRMRDKLKTQEDKADHFVREHVNHTPMLRYPMKEPRTGKLVPEPLPRALRRFLNEIRDPVVQHRARLFDRVLDALVKRYGRDPEYVVVECVRSLAEDGDQAEQSHAKREQQRRDNQHARDMLRTMGFEANDANVRKFKLLQECKWRNPYDPADYFMQSDFAELIISRMVPSELPAGAIAGASDAMNATQIEHMVPQSQTVCDEWYNLTVTRPNTNSQKNNLIPWEFCLRDADEETRARLLSNAAECFTEGTLKHKIFCQPDARSLVNARDNLQRTAYLARVIRYICLLKFGWLDEEDRDPAHVPGNDPSRRYLVSNGALTSRLRRAWQLNELLHGERMVDEAWNALSQEEKDEVIRQRQIKNRQDLRHHALDALVAACTLPWAANSSVHQNGWCNLDPRDQTITSVRCPIFGDDDHGQQIREVARIQLALLLEGIGRKAGDANAIVHYRSNQKHRQIFDANLHGKRTHFGGKPLGKAQFVIRKPLSSLHPNCLIDPESKQLEREIGKQECGQGQRLGKREPGDLIFSPKLRSHIRDAWIAFAGLKENWDRVVADTIGYFEEQRRVALGKPGNKAKNPFSSQLTRLKGWANANPSMDAWAGIMKFIHESVGRARQGAKNVFPRQFIETLRHPDYGTPIVSVKVVVLTQDEDAYLPIDKERANYLRYTGGYKELRVYDGPVDAPKNSHFVCWFVRPYYKKEIDPETGRRKTDEQAHKPAKCGTLHPRAVFRKGQVIRFVNAIASKNIAAHSLWVVEGFERANKSPTKANITVVPSHLANSVRDPNNSTKPINLKATEARLIPLDEFMRGLDYEPAPRPLKQRRLEE